LLKPETTANGSLLIEYLGFGIGSWLYEAVTRNLEKLLKFNQLFDFDSVIRFSTRWTAFARSPTPRGALENGIQDLPNEHDNRDQHDEKCHDRLPVELNFFKQH
jgi:hypothetical protein